MKNVLKTLGIIFIIALALFVAACGDPLPVDPVVTFNSNGGSAVSSQTVAKDGLATKPSNPSKDKLTVEGLYKGSTASTFVKWLKDNGDEYVFSTPVTASITLTAEWDDPKPEVLGTGNDDIFNKAVTKIGTDNGNYTLALKEDFTATKAISFGTGTVALNLTIINIGGQKTITSPNLSSSTDKVFLIIGPNTGTNNSKLTLKNVALKGSGTATGDSLVRVRGGAELILDDGSGVNGHNNNIGNATYNGANGNGSAICVVTGGILTIKGGAVIEGNESSGTNQNNRNLVGGVYGYNGKINIEGGIIEGNTCPDGHTKDIYVIEDCELTVKGFVTVGQLTLNTESGSVKNTVIKIPSGVTNRIDKLCLRSSENTLTAVKTNWTNKTVLEGTGGYTVTSDDVAKFHLGEFRGTAAFTGADISTGFKIDDSGTNLGKLVAVP